jgi:hypothetical protein
MLVSPQEIPFSLIKFNWLHDLPWNCAVKHVLRDEARSGLKHSLISSRPPSVRALLTTLPPPPRSSSISSFSLFSGIVLKTGQSCDGWLWARIFKRLWSPGIDSKEWIPPAYVAWRVGTINPNPTRFLATIYCLKIPAPLSVWSFCVIPLVPCGDPDVR